jgi:thiol-disulfide isomerase/thioredoxin
MVDSRAMNRSFPHVSFPRLRVLALALALLAVGAGLALADPPPSPPPSPPIEQPAPAPPKTAAPATERPVLLGHVQREQVEAAVSDWVEAEVASAPDAEVVKRLAAVGPGATVTVFLGSWCGDSRREVSRFWHVLDEAGGDLPFAISYVGVDPAKKEPADLVSGNDLRYVPTFIVRRDGREVGRIVESAPHGIERDLLSLLDGSAHGLVTGRADLGDAKPTP